MTSRRVQQINASGIRRVFDLAAKLKNPVNLSIGQPDFDAPENVRAAATRAIAEHKNGYTVTQGVEPLRESIRQKYNISGSSDVDVFVSSGVSGGLFLSYAVLLDPEDEVLIPDPYFCMYRDLALLLSAVPVYYDCHPSFSISLEDIERGISPRTKAIVVNSPSNPTGIASTQEEVDAVIEIARRHDLWLIYDEIYEAYCYDFPHANAFGHYEKTIILNGCSKSHGIPGWRIGYVVAPTTILADMLKVQQYSFVCAPSIAQWGILAGFSDSWEHTTERYREKRDFIYNALKNHFDVRKPSGAFYIYPKAPGSSGQAFVEKCIANELLVVPGNVFSRRDSHFRISFSAEMKTLERGAEILQSLAPTRQI